MHVHWTVIQWLCIPVFEFTSTIGLLTNLICNHCIITYQTGIKHCFDYFTSINPVHFSKVIKCALSERCKLVNNTPFDMNRIISKTRLLIVRILLRLTKFKYSNFSKHRINLVIIGVDLIFCYILLLSTKVDCLVDFP